MTNNKCPITGKMGQSIEGGIYNKEWCTNSLNLDMLHQNSTLGNPMSKCFNYAKEFIKLDYEALKVDLYMLMTDSVTRSQPACSSERERTRRISVR